MLHVMFITIVATFTWILIPALAKAEDGKAIIHNGAYGEDEETVVDRKQAMDFDDFLFDRARLVGKSVILSGYMTYKGGRLGTFRSSMESVDENEEISVIVGYLPDPLRREMFKRCKKLCEVDFRGRVTRDDTVLLIDVDLYRKMGGGQGFAPNFLY